jgi:3-oxoacyl-[acyl-carrier protein] reductase
LGARLELSDINQAGVEETNKLCDSKHATTVVDVGSTVAVNGWVESIVKKHGSIDHVFSNAGINPTSTVLTSLVN